MFAPSATRAARFDAADGAGSSTETALKRKFNATVADGADSDLR